MMKNKPIAIICYITIINDIHLMPGMYLCMYVSYVSTSFECFKKQIHILMYTGYIIMRILVYGFKWIGCCVAPSQVVLIFVLKGMFVIKSKSWYFSLTLIQVYL